MRYDKYCLQQEGLPINLWRANNSLSIAEVIKDVQGNPVAYNSSSCNLFLALEVLFGGKFYSIVVAELSSMLFDDSMKFFYICIYCKKKLL